MLIKRKDLDAIVAGDIDLQFRKWTRSTVKAGGFLRTAVGVLAIGEVKKIAVARITADDVRRAGYASKTDLLGSLARRDDGDVYRVAVRYEGEDPRKALRESADLTKADRAEIDTRLARFDKASRRGPWTARFLELIRDNEAVRAPDLADSIGQDKPWFKTNVRKLKELGLTESLKVGYRLSPRGQAYLK